jgi:hypothetical protein
MASSNDRFHRRREQQERFNEQARNDYFDRLTSGVVGVPVIYEGVTYRSKVEARWAVFFDTLGIVHEYERSVRMPPSPGDPYSGYEIHPDFWLSDSGVWAEVKSNEFSDEARDRVHDLVCETYRPCVMLIGTPKLKHYEIIESKEGGGTEVMDFTFAYGLRFTDTEVRIAVRSAKSAQLTTVESLRPIPPEPKIMVDSITGSKTTIYPETGPSELDSRRDWPAKSRGKTLYPDARY